ncbi:MAG: HEAT repeat domain-containing protein [Gemmataceae bacterium]
MPRIFLILLPALALSPVTPARAQEKDATAEEEQRLKGAFQPTDGPGLVAFLRARAAGAASPERLAELVEALEGKGGAARLKACGELVAAGPPAIPPLRRAARDVDSPEAAGLARQCLKLLEDDPGQLTTAAVRLLVARRPAGTAEALLAYLPHAESDAVLDELKEALGAVAHDKGKADEAVVRALSDGHPLRRASAVVALTANGSTEPREALRRLLLDPMPSVRLRASLVLARAHDAKAVSTLITLLADLPEPQAREVEEYLKDLAGEQAPKVAYAADARSRERARDAWARWWLDTEGPGPLDEVKRRTLTEVDAGHVQAVIEKLGDDAFEVRQKAEEELRKLGGRIVPLLKEAQKSPDLEIRNRATKCLAAIETEKTPPLSPVTARLLALRKPKGAAAALLAYLPFADEESLAEDVQAALNAAAFRGGKADEAVLQALADKNSTRRAAAAVALCHGPVAEYLPRLRPLLKDRDPAVRAKVTLALAGAREPEAVPGVIALVRDLPGDAGASAEDFLFRLARDEPPRGLPEGDDNRAKRAAAWEGWWATHKGALAALERQAPAVRRRELGYTLLVQTSNNMIVEWDKERRVRWQLTGLANPWDAQWLPGNRLLVAEYNAQRVTERNLKGEILWTANVGNWPMQAERLANGRTFVTCRNALYEFDRGGKQVAKIDRPASDIMTARKLANGQVVVVTQNRQLLRLDRSGKEVKSALLPGVFSNQNEILPNGHVLLPMGWMNALAEYNADGKEVARLTVPAPMHAIRLDSGNVLVSSQNWPYRIYEFDKKGHQVGDYTTNNAYVFRVRRR